MKKLIPIFLAVLCLTACGNEQVKNPDTLSTAVISSSDSVTAKNTLNSLNESTVATLTADKIDASNIGDLSDYDVLYIDKSVVETGGFNASAVEEYVSNGGSVFLDNDVYNVFDKDFIGAEDFVTIDSCPVDMIYPENSDKGIKKIQSLLSDFSMLYRNYADYNDVLVNQDYGVGVVPSTAECIASKDNVGIYTVNQYGNGYVFFTNPLLPNSFSVNNLSPDDTGEYLSATTVGANKLLRDYFAEFVSLKNYGYAVEHVLGSFAKPVASWELHYEDITGIDNGSAEIFEETARNEAAHAKLWFGALGKLGGTLDNLKDAQAGERFEWTDIYARFEREALDEGFERTAALFRMVGAIERMHDERYGALIRQLEKETLYRKMQPVQWICPVCGRVHEGTEPPEYCPVCGQPRGAFRPI